MSRNPVSARGYKSGLSLRYISDRSLSVLPGECHYCHISDDFDDQIISMQSEFILELIYTTPWHYHYVYISPDLIYYDITPPEYDIDKLGFYHPIDDSRCIGTFFIADGYIFQFKQLTAAQHSFGPYDILKFTRMYTDVPGFIWPRDRIIETTMRPNLTWDINWTTIKFHIPNWGPIDKSCNMYPQILLYIITSTEQECVLIYRSVNTDIDTSRRTIQPEIPILQIPQSNETVFPNKYWNEISKPLVHQLVIQTNEDGLAQFRPSQAANNATELSTIGCVLPKYIGENKGKLPEKYLGIFEGLNVSYVSPSEFLITSGRSFFPHPIEFAVLKSNLRISPSRLERQSLYWIYISSAIGSSILSENCISVSLIRPIQNKYGFFQYYLDDDNHIQLKNIRCIGTIRTGDNGQIKSVFPIRDYGIEPPFCNWSANDEVFRILQDSFRILLPSRLDRILQPWMKPIPYIDQNDPPQGPFNLPLIPDPYNPCYRLQYDHFSEFYKYDQLVQPTFSMYDLSCQIKPARGFVWEQIDPIQYNYCESHLLYRAPLKDRILRNSIYLYELNLNQRVRVIEKNNTSLELIIDSWELCDDIIYSEYAYFLAQEYGDVLKRPVICDFSLGKRECNDVFSKDDDVIISTFDTTSYHDLLSIEHTISVDDAINNDMKCARIIHHTPNIELQNTPLEYSYPLISTKLRLLDDFIETYTYDSTTFTIHRQQDLELFPANLRLFEDPCQPIMNISFNRVVRPLNVSFLLDYCFNPTQIFINQSNSDSSSFCFITTPETLPYYELDVWAQPFCLIDEFLVPTDQFECHELLDFKYLVSDFIYKLDPKTILEIVDINSPKEPILESQLKSTNSDSCIYYPPIIEDCEFADYFKAVKDSLDRLSVESNSQNVIVLIGNNFIDYHTHSFLELGLFAISKLCKIYCITFDFYNDLDYLCKITGGKYYFGKSSTLNRMLFQLQTEIQHYEYKIDWEPIAKDGNSHSLIIRSVGTYYGEIYTSFIAELWKSICKIE